MLVKFRKLPQERRVFLFLIGFRWASLLPAFWALIARSQNTQVQLVSPAIVLMIAIGSNVIISLFYRRLNRLTRKFPPLLGVDMLFTSSLLAISHGTESAYFLYAVSPLLAGAFIFQIRGALASAGVFTPLYLIAVTVSSRQFQTPLDTNSLFTQLSGIWLLPILLGYPSVVLERLRTTRDDLTSTKDSLEKQNMELTSSHHQLKIIHDLTILIQAAPDIETVQRQALKAVTEQLGFKQAAVALVDPISEHLGQWNTHPIKGFPPNGLAALSLDTRDDPLISTMLDRKVRWTENHEQVTSNAEINAWLGKSSWLILPMTMQDHPVGVLLVSYEGTKGSFPKDQLLVITAVANQAAIALGTTLLCIDRARRLAVEQERNRIARDIHDTVSQSLFGIVFGLDASIDMLPGQPEPVLKELVELRSLASSTRDEVRKSIYDLWPSVLTLERFKSDLSSYAAHCSRPNAFQVVFSTNGNFEQLSSGIRRSLYRVAQEALSNAARHSGTSSAHVCLHVEQDQAHMSIYDKGRGFDPQIVLARAYNRDRFGLHGIQERVSAIGGQCEILSQQGNGTRLLINIPLNNQKNNDS